MVYKLSERQVCRVHVKPRWLLGALAIVTCPPLLAQDRALESKDKSAVRDVVSVQVTPELHQRATRAIKVEMRFRGDPDGETVLLLPRNDDLDIPYWKDVSNIQVLNAAASAPTPDRRVLKHSPGAPITVTYEITPALPPGPWKTVVAPGYFSTLGEGIFSQLEGRQPRFLFSWGAMPQGWSFASDLDHHAMRTGGTSDDLLASALMAGSEVSVQRRKNGKGILRVAVPNGAHLDPVALANRMAHIAATSNRLWEDRGNDYFISLTPLSTFGLSVAGIGLRDGYAAYLPADPEEQRLIFTLAHEHTHTWIDAQMGESPAWFREGFTNYYGNLVNLAGGEYPLGTFVQFWNESLLRYANSPYRLKSDAEADKKFFGDRDAMWLAYDRGMMLAALLDYRLRRETRGKVTLADVLLRVKREVTRKAGTGDGPTRMVRVARALSGIDLQPEIDRFVGRGENLALPEDLFGRCATIATITIPKYNQGFRGIFGRPIEKVNEEGPAYAAGLRPGMILLKRETGVTGDSRVEMALRVRDGESERVIRYKPIGTGTVTLQEIRAKDGLSPNDVKGCARSIAMFR